MKLLNHYMNSGHPISAAQTTMVSKLEALQCHFTWDLHHSRSKLLFLREQLEDIGTEEGNSWLGHTYNLRGFIQYQLGFTEDSQSFFNQAAEAFNKLRHADEGPWLVVNYGNLAWLHHHLGDQAESEAYQSKVDALMEKYPSPSQDELHPEIYAEKAWTLMEFSAERKLVPANYFKRAIRIQPDMVEWNTSYVLATVKTFKYSSTGVNTELLEKMRIAKEQDPENLYLAICYLEQRAKKGERVEDEARELAQKVLRNPVSSYSGIKAVLRVYQNYVSVDEAIDLAEEALKNHPDERYLKKCAALCYNKKIVCCRESRPEQSEIARAVSLYKEVISLYPHSSLRQEIDLANIYAKSSYGLAKAEEAEQIYQELLKRDLDRADKQMLYSLYAKHRFFNCRDYQGMIKYNKKAAEIPHQSGFRRNSIMVLSSVRDRSRSREDRNKTERFLKNLKEP